MRTRSAAAQRDFETDGDQTKALAASRRRRDNAMDRLDNITSTSNPNGDASNDEAPASTIARPARLTDASGLDLDDSVFANLEDGLDDTIDADETHNTHQTRSTDTSSFNVAAFRRRPRASSVAGRDDAPIRPSSRGPNTPSISSHLNLSRFRRRQREPSILGTAQKDVPSRPPSQMSNYGNLMGDDSGPEDESTPLDKTKRLSGQVPHVDTSRQASPVVTSRKRKSLEEQAGREKRLALDAGSDGEEIMQSVEVQSTPPASPSTSTPFDPDDPDMAPPVSSGSSAEGSPSVWPPLSMLAHKTFVRQRRAAGRHRTKTPEPQSDVASDVSSPPSLTHSPNYDDAAHTRAKPKAKKKPAAAALKSPPKISTAALLTNLLPRRRSYRRRGTDDSGDEDPYNLDSSDANPNDDEDELSYADTRARRGLKSTSRNAKSGKRPTSALKKRKAGRTRGARASDKENATGDEGGETEASIHLGSEAEDQDGPVEENTQMLKQRLGSELARAKKYFERIDKVKLTFEDVAGSSSPPPIPPSSSSLPNEAVGDGVAAEAAAEVALGDGYQAL